MDVNSYSYQPERWGHNFWITLYVISHTMGNEIPELVVEQYYYVYQKLLQLVVTGLNQWDNQT